MTNTLFTAYCACQLCCGKQATGLNALSRPPIEGLSIAAPRAVPLGTKVLVKIPGLLTNAFIVDDRTARRFDGRWDVFINSHQRALRFGKRTGTVEILK